MKKLWCRHSVVDFLTISFAVFLAMASVGQNFVTYNFSNKTVDLRNITEQGVNEWMTDASLPLAEPLAMSVFVRR